MVKRLLILLLLVAATVSAVPALRNRVEPVMQPLVTRAARAAAPVVGHVLDPIFGWSAHGEEERYLADLRARVNTGQPLPAPREFQRHLERTARSGRGGNDPWGSPYYLELTLDSIRVGSAGPDRKRGTDDDVLTSVSRR